MVGPEILVFFQGSKSRYPLIYHLVYGIKSNLDLTGCPVYNLTIYPVRWAHVRSALDVLIGLLHREHGWEGEGW